MDFLYDLGLVVGKMVMIDEYLLGKFVEEVKEFELVKVIVM